MALVKCKDCGNEASRKASSCPKCGAPIKKKTSAITWIVAILACLWLVGYLGSLEGASGSSTSTSGNTSQVAAASPKVYQLKQTVHVGYTTYAVWKASYRDRLNDNTYLNQPPNGSYLLVELTVRNDDTKARSIPPFKLVDENGAEYETSSNAWMVDGSIGVLDSLNPSVKKQGYIVFDVPRGKHYKLKVSGGYWSSDEALIDLKL